jgi:hypothetical protein
LKSVAKSGGFVSLIPPRRPFDEGILNLLRRAAVNVINNRFDGFANRRVRVFFLKTMATIQRFSRFSEMSVA